MRSVDDDGRMLPSEHAHRPALRWPADVSDLTGIPEPTLKKMRSDGDSPRMCALGRALFVTHTALRVWIEAHELAAGERVRPATVPKGSKITRRSKPGAT